MDTQKYLLKCIEAQTELAKKGIKSDSEKLAYVKYSIRPYSVFWRMGVVKALDHAIKLLQKEEKGGETIESS